MKGRWILAGIFGLATLVGAGMAVLTWTGPDGGPWIFVAFAALFAVMTWATVRPAKPRKPREPTGTQFGPSWFFEGAILLLAVLILLTIASCLFGRGR